MTLTDAHPAVLGIVRAAREAEPDGPTLDEIRNWPATVGIRRACTALGISGSYGYQLAAEGRFPCRVLPIGGRTRVITSSLLATLDAEDP